MSTADQERSATYRVAGAYAARMGWRMYEYTEKDSNVKIDGFARSMKDLVTITLSGGMALLAHFD